MSEYQTAPGDSSCVAAARKWGERWLDFGQFVGLTDVAVCIGAEGLNSARLMLPR